MAQKGSRRAWGTAAAAAYIEGQDSALSTMNTHPIKGEELTQQEVSEFLDAVAEQAMANIRSPHGGYNNAHILGEALKLKAAAKSLRAFRVEVAQVNEQREKN